jgi:hypothetical protein
MCRKKYKEEKGGATIYVHVLTCYRHDCKTLNVFFVVVQNESSSIDVESSKESMLPIHGTCLCARRALRVSILTQKLKHNNNI